MTEPIRMLKNKLENLEKAYSFLKSKGSNKENLSHYKERIESFRKAIEKLES